MNERMEGTVSAKVQYGSINIAHPGYQKRRLALTQMAMSISGDQSLVEECCKRFNRSVSQNLEAGRKYITIL